MKDEHYHYIVTYMYEDLGAWNPGRLSIKRDKPVNTLNDVLEEFYENVKNSEYIMGIIPFECDCGALDE